MTTYIAFGAWALSEPAENVKYFLSQETVDLLRAMSAQLSMREFVVANDILFA